MVSTADDRAERGVCAGLPVADFVAAAEMASEGDTGVLPDPVPPLLLPGDEVTRETRGEEERTRAWVAGAAVAVAVAADFGDRRAAGACACTASGGREATALSAARATSAAGARSRARSTLTTVAGVNANGLVLGGELSPSVSPSPAVAVAVVVAVAADAEMATAARGDGKVRASAVVGLETGSSRCPRIPPPRPCEEAGGDCGSSLQISMRESRRDCGRLLVPVPGRPAPVVGRSARPWASKSVSGAGRLREKMRPTPGPARAWGGC